MAGASDQRMDIDAAAKKGVGYSWEGEYTRSWERVLTNLESDGNEMAYDEWQSRDRVIEGVRRGMIRYVWLIIDASDSMRDMNFRPSKIDVAIRSAHSFVRDFFDQNPLSHMGILVMLDCMTQLVTKMSANSRHHLDELDRFTVNCRGQASVQNAIDHAGRALENIPNYGSREILIVFGSIATCDAGDILKSIDELAAKDVRCSVVSLAAEVYVCRRLTSTCNGTYAVADSEDKVLTLLQAHCLPPPVAKKKPLANLVRMGFPDKVVQHTKVNTFCACHQAPRPGGFACPRCKFKYCDLPADCSVCGLTLVSSPHLARSYHHLFPVPLFKKSDQPPLTDLTCFSCMTSIASPQALRLVCPRCEQVFCVNCEVFIHETLHNCPGCDSRTNPQPTNRLDHNKVS